jgi:hypothetical protein
MSRFESLFAGLALFALAAIVRADTVKLEGGGTVRGEILDDKSTKDVLVVKSRGAEVKIQRSRIQEIVREKTAGQEYEEIKGDYAETAEDQFRLAMWCDSRRLAKQRKEHLLKVIELDPDHAQAREKLGYVRLDGKWLTADEAREAKGLVKYNGRFVTPQEKEILEQKKLADDATREWFQKIRQWKMWLTGNDSIKARLGEEKLRGIDDPLAFDAIVGQFGKEKEDSLRVLMCELLANIEGEEPTLELVRRAIADISDNVRWAAVERLVERDDPAAVRSLLKLLSSDHNTVVRRAAEAIGAIGDPTAVPGLIDALVTKHKQIVTRGQQTSFSGTVAPVGVFEFEPIVAPGAVAFRPIVGYQASGAGFSTISKEVVTLSVENQEVLDALREITKEDFGYNQATWRQWLAAQKRKEDMKNRR